MAGPDARRVRRGADRAGRPVEHRAVGRVAAVPAVALDAALEALALRDADDIHELARLEHPLLARHIPRRGATPPFRNLPPGLRRRSRRSKPHTGRSKTPRREAPTSAD